MDAKPYYIQKRILNLAIDDMGSNPDIIQKHLLDGIFSLGSGLFCCLFELQERQTYEWGFYIYKKTMGSL
jgi:hypothetical protein